MKVTTAIIFAGGFGRRMLPITQAVQKELLPILDRPAIDYVVEDCIAAGIKNIIFVTREGSHGLKDYYVGDAGVENYLKRLGKADDLAKLKKIHDQANYTFVEQPEVGDRGTAIVATLAWPKVPEGEASVVCDGDAFSWHPDHHSEAADMIKLFEESNAKAVFSAREISPDEIHLYGALSVESKQGREYLRDFVEKPSPGTAPSNLSNISKYILTPEVMEYVKRVAPDPQSGEHYLPQGIRDAAQNLPVVVHRAGGKFLEVGSLQNWFNANLVVGKNDPRLGNLRNGLA
jgi:UTP--glucose-1-phosphate uridylyltransferase